MLIDFGMAHTIDRLVAVARRKDVMENENMEYCTTSSNEIMH